MNTEVNYFHRNECNFKDFFSVVIAGEMTDEQEDEIKDLMPNDEFCPSDVGFDESQDCEWWCIEYTDRAPTIDITTDELVARFHKAYDRNPAHEGKNPYSVTIKEISSRTIIVWAEDALEAEQKAEDLCDESEINLVADDFDYRECNCSGLAPKGDFDYFDVFD